MKFDKLIIYDKKYAYPNKPLIKDNEIMFLNTKDIELKKGRVVFWNEGFECNPKEVK